MKAKKPKRIQRVALTRPTGWLSNLVWAFINLDEPALEQIDRKIAALIWPPANFPLYTGHTISWILGQLEKNGDPTATGICDLLAIFLGPNHCVNAVSVVQPVQSGALTIEDVTDELLLLQEHLTQLIEHTADNEEAVQDLALIAGLRRRILESGIQP